MRVPRGGAGAGGGGREVAHPDRHRTLSQSCSKTAKVTKGLGAVSNSISILLGGPASPRRQPRSEKWVSVRQMATQTTISCMWASWFIQW